MRYNLCRKAVVCTLLSGMFAFGSNGAEWLYSNIPYYAITQGWGRAQYDKSLDGRPLKIGGVTYEHGLGSHTDATFSLRLDGNALQATGAVGVDDEVGKGEGSVNFQWFDDSNANTPKLLWESGVMHSGDAAKKFDLNLKDIKVLRFVADKVDITHFDHANLVDFKVVYDQKAPAAIHPGMIVATDNMEWVFRGEPGGKLLQYGIGKVSKSNSTSALINYPHRGEGGFLLDENIRVIQADGSHNLDLRYVSRDVQKISDNVTVDTYNLKDLVYPIEAKLVITSYKKQDIIKSQLVLTNNGDKEIQVGARDAAMVGLPSGEEAFLTSFNGEWIREMTGVEETKLPMGIIKHQHRGVIRTAWPDYPGCFIAFGHPAQEEQGDVFAAAIAWTGSWQYKVSSLPTGERFFSAGVPGEDIIKLAPHESYTSPEVVMTFSTQGKGQASRNFHQYAFEYGIYNGKTLRPVILNSWEGVFFTFDENKIIELMDGAAQIGIEMFVLDDGWFGNKHQRNGDNAGLGDWQVNQQKLPGGIEHLIDEAEKRGLDFGLWVEPEMVNPQSELFEKHPDWAMRVPNRDLYPARNQYVLDLSQKAVEDFVYDTVSGILTEHPRIKYIKWDHNCIGLNVGSAALGDNQGALSDKHTQAYYRIMEKLRKNFPNVKFQLCSSGGGRVDMGSMRYNEEFWASDETNGIRRIPIQWGWSHFFPANAMGSHIGKHGDGDFKFRADVAMTGRLGVELAPGTIDEASRMVVKKGIETYKTIRPFLHQADLFRGRSPHDSDITELTFVGKDKKEAVFFGFKRTEGKVEESLKVSGLNPENKYKYTELNPDDEKRIEVGEATGLELMNKGIKVKFPEKFSSVVVKLDAI